MTGHLGVLPVGLTVASTVVKGDIDGEPSGGAIRSPAAATTDVVRRRRWRAHWGVLPMGLAVATTEVVRRH
jgi:hypothetical protein